MKYTAKAHWEGSLKQGKGTLSTQSGALKETSYTFHSRFEENEAGTNPEELLAATHAGCFTMAVCGNLTKRGYDPAVLDTQATVTMVKEGITGIHLAIKGRVAKLSADEFDEVVRHESKNCIISRALSIPISAEASLLS